MKNSISNQILLFILFFFIFFSINTDASIFSDPFSQGSISKIPTISPIKTISIATPGINKIGPSLIEQNSRDIEQILVQEKTDSIINKINRDAQLKMLSSVMGVPIGIRDDEIIDNLNGIMAATLEPPFSQLFSGYGAFKSKTDELFSATALLNPTFTGTYTASIITKNGQTDYLIDVINPTSSISKKITYTILPPSAISPFKDPFKTNSISKINNDLFKTSTGIIGSDLLHPSVITDPISDTNSFFSDISSPIGLFSLTDVFEQNDYTLKTITTPFSSSLSNSFSNSYYNRPLYTPSPFSSINHFSSPSYSSLGGIGGHMY